MNKINIDGIFQLSLPDNWEIELAKNLITCYNNSGFGAVQISYFFVEPSIVIDLKKELSSFFQVSLNETTKDIDEKNKINFILHKNNNDFWFYGIKRLKDVVFFITYNCTKEDAFIEEKDVWIILESIRKITKLNIHS